MRLGLTLTIMSLLAINPAPPSMPWTHEIQWSVQPIPNGVPWYMPLGGGRYRLLFRASDPFGSPVQLGWTLDSWQRWDGSKWLPANDAPPDLAFNRDRQFEAFLDCGGRTFAEPRVCIVEATVTNGKTYRPKKLSVLILD